MAGASCVLVADVVPAPAALLVSKRSPSVDVEIIVMVVGSIAVQVTVGVGAAEVRIVVGAAVASVVVGAAAARVVAVVVELRDVVATCVVSSVAGNLGMEVMVAVGDAKLRVVAASVVVTAATGVADAQVVVLALEMDEGAAALRSTSMETFWA